MGNLRKQADVTKRTKKCSIPECDRAVEKREWCNMHYKRWLRHGDPTYVSIIVGDDVARFNSYVDKSPNDKGCWEWNGNRNQNGYGRFKLNGRYVSAHRYTWERVNGKIPEGMEIDHRCHNRACVNVTHLRLATNKQNLENMSGPRADSTTGYRGVNWDTKSNKYRALVVHHGERHIAGWFDCPHEANEAVVALRNELYTHNDLDRIVA